MGVRGKAAYDSVVEVDFFGGMLDVALVMLWGRAEVDSSVLQRMTAGDSSKGTPPMSASKSMKLSLQKLSRKVRLAYFPTERCVFSNQFMYQRYCDHAGRMAPLSNSMAVRETPTAKEV